MAKIFFRLKELMEERGINQSQLCKETGLSYPTINQIYNNGARRIDFGTLEVLVDYFGCDFEDILAIDKTPTR
jgi:hypothetical protein